MEIMGSDIIRYKATGIPPRKQGSAGGGGGPAEAYETADALDPDLGRQRPNLPAALRCGLGSRAEDRSAIHLAREPSRQRRRFVGDDERALCPVHGQEWSKRLDAASVPFGQVQSVPELLEDDAIMSEFLTTVRRTDGVEVPQVRTPVRLASGMTEVRLPPPALGEHTDEVLREELGYPAEKIDSLRSEGVIS